MSTEVSINRGSVLQLTAAQLADYRDTFMQVQKGIHSIPPAYQNTSIESHHLRGLKIEFLPKYADKFGKKLSNHIGAAQDVLIDNLKNRLNDVKEDIEWVENGGGAVSHILEIQLSYERGGISSLGTAVFAWKKMTDTTIEVAHAIYGEKWREQDGVKLIRGADCWNKENIKKYLTYNLIMGLPDNFKSKFKAIQMDSEGESY